MKILMVNKFYYRFGGAETYFFALADLLRKSGHTVIPFSMKHPLNEASDFEEFFVDQVEYNGEESTRKISSALSSIYSVTARRNIGRLIDLTKPDIVHLHNYNYQITPSILFEINRRRIPIVQTLHDPQLVCPHHRLYDYNTQRICERCVGLHFYQAIRTKCIKSSYLKSTLGALESYLYHGLNAYKYVSAFISPSKFLKRKIQAMGFSNARIEHIPNFVDLGDGFESTQDKSIALYLGRLSHEKGLLTLMSAMEKVESCELLLAGDGPLRQQLSELASRNPRNNVKLLGYQNFSEVRSLLKKCAFTVLPTEMYENLPFSVMESFAEGKPAIASDLGGLTEMVIPDKTGFLFPPGDAESLTLCIDRLAKSTEMCQQMGRNARVFAKTNYDKNMHLERILMLYDEFVRTN